jgi:tRNA threonylcarbamoyladenosine biosynthesis protein TsaE
VIRLGTVEATLDLGVALGKQLRAGDLVILGGSLGAGKTTLTKGIATGMGVSGRVTSPTFVIARVHRPDVASNRSVPLVHVDAYRLSGALELDDLDLDTDLDAAAVVIEWGEGVAEQLSSERLTIELVRLPDDTRTAELIAVGDRWQTRIQDVVGAIADSVGAESSYGSE